MKLKRILLATDLSEPAELAMQQAVELAVQHQAELNIFHVVTLHAEDPKKLKEALESYLKDLEEEVYSDLANRSEEIRRRGVRVEVTLDRAVSPFESIVDKASESQADLIVIGTHGRSGFGKLLLGSVAEKVVRHAPCNVMTVGPECAVAEGISGFERVLVPVDFAEYSEKAIGIAKALLSPQGALTLIHVVSSPIHPSFYAGGVTELFQLDPELPARIREKLGELYDGPGDLLVSEGDIASDVLSAAEKQNAELIVMGTRGLSGLDHVLVGSVTERVIRQAKVPVLAVK